MKVLLASLLCIVLGSCAGYRLGGVKPTSLAGIRKVSVPMFLNGSQHPRAESLATSSVSDAIVQDGTYRIAEGSEADAVLEGKLAGIGYSTLRSSRLDSLRAEELTNVVTIEWTLRDARDPTRVLASGVNQGTSSFFVDSNLQTARQNALADAMKRASVSLVSTLASGY